MTCIKDLKTACQYLFFELTIIMFTSQCDSSAKVLQSKRENNISQCIHTHLKIS